MQILRNKNELNHLLEKIRKNRQEIGLIPTMGSIHDGHLSLIGNAKKDNLFSLVSIYVNPTQFNEDQDFKDYPRNEKKDVLILKKINCDALYLPLHEEMYSKGLIVKKIIFEYRDILCDKFRPGHFDGVISLVKSLFEVVKPEHAFFGEKDFQQLKLIQKFVNIYEVPLTIHSCPSIRLQNGISFSSRFNNFSANQKNILNNCAKCIYDFLNQLKKNIESGIIENLKKELIKIVGVKIDYLEIRDERTLRTSNTQLHSRLFIAFYIGNIRILDNFVLY